MPAELDMAPSRTADSSSPDADDVRAFYDSFTSSTMIQYRLYGNARIDAAIARVLPLLHEFDTVLEVGCGIGMVAEQIARNVQSGRVLGIDISPRNIWYAGQTVRMKNLSFAVVDAVTGLDSVPGMLGGPADLVVMIDVVEHLPEDQRPCILRRLRALSSRSAMLVLTYPSPQYQEFLRKNSPDDIQLIDNTIVLSTLQAEAEAAGYHLRHYSLEDVWQPNQYCHVVFQTDETMDGERLPWVRRRGLPERLVRKAGRILFSRLIRRYRRWKYLDRVFRER